MKCDKCEKIAVYKITREGTLEDHKEIHYSFWCEDHMPRWIRDGDYNHRDSNIIKREII